jgi:oxygen-independent coproporphyrinogen III oxidase
MTQVSSLYLHVPFCKHLCNYCDFYKKLYEPQTDQIEDFHQFLKLSVERHQTFLAEEKTEVLPLETMYLGGGTPSLWGTRGAEFFRNHILKYFPLQKECEFTMEVDPGTWTEDMMNAWKEVGLNRISIGTQTLHPDFLKIMDRAHTLEESLKLLSYCRDNDWNFSLDFLLGIPYSQPKNRNIIEELDLLLQYKPKHISLYILNARSKYPHTQSLPDDEYISEEFLKVSDHLKGHGFHHYEVSNFALPGHESKHNMKYWKSESVAALGPTGTGLVFHSKEKAVRYKWKVTKPEFEIENLGPSELALEEQYLGLRTSLGWKPTLLTDSLKNVFQSWEKRGLGEFKQERMILNPKGFIILDSLMDDIFAQE